MKQTLSLIALIAAVPALAEDSRELGAHEHGRGTLNIAFDGASIAMEFEAPGADIVGFEYVATSDADLAAIDAAITTLSAPLDLFVLPDAATCLVVAAEAEIEDGTGHDDHGDHEDHDHDDHEDEDHAGDDHADHDHEDHEDHGEHNDHDDHEAEASHTEFHAAYTLICDNPEAVADIDFAYFSVFPNAQEVEVQIITASGAQAFDVDRDMPVLDLGR